jgi:hypothetical protein
MHRGQLISYFYLSFKGHVQIEWVNLGYKLH